MQLKKTSIQKLESGEIYRMIQNMHKQFIMLIGLPGSGKTTFCLQRFPDPQFIRISLDDFRKNVLGYDFFPPVEPVVHSWAEMTGRYLFSLGYSIVIDATSVTTGIRKKWTSMAKSYGYTTKACLLQTSAEVCIERNARRSRKVPPEVITRMLNQWEPLCPLDEMFDSVEVITSVNGKFIVHEGSAPSYDIRTD